MWTGGPPPPLPAAHGDTDATTPTLMVARSQSFRPGDITAELAALRQRGLAKVLNKHFTETTKQLALEKAAADAALQDLERRKAHTSQFQPSGDGELSPLDAMYLSVHQWRNECRRKEKETLLLYQRYVDKFGATGQVKAPPVQDTTSPLPLSSSSSPSSPGDQTDVPSPTAAPPPQSPPSFRHSKQQPPPPTAVQVPSMAAAIESALEEFLAKGALAVPSIETLSTQETYQSSFSKEEAEFRNYYRRQLEQRGVDAKATDPARKVVEEEKKGDDQNQFYSPDPFLRTIGETENNEKVDQDDEEYSGSDNDDDKLGPLVVQTADDDTVVSCLTFNSALTREILDDCNRTVVTFLQEEQEAIRKIMEEQDEDLDAMTANQSTSELSSVCCQAAEQAENMARQMQEILDKFEEKNKKKDEHDAKAGEQLKEGQTLETGNPNEEWIVYYDETYGRNYYHEVRSNKTQWESPLAADDDGAEATTAGSTTDGHSTSPALLLASDVVPESLKSMVGSSEKRRSSRISQYRRRRRRQRKRRMFAVAFVIVSSLTALAFYLHTHPQSALSKAGAAKVLLPIVNKIVDMKRLEQLVQSAHHSIEKMFGRSSSKPTTMINTATPINKEAQYAKETDRLANLVAEKAAKEAKAAREAELARQQLEARLQKEAAERAKKEAEALALAEEERLRKEQEAARKEQERLEAERLAREAYLRRPWECNVPFAYLFRTRCRDLATQNPPFNLSELIMSMLQ